MSGRCDMAAMEWQEHGNSVTQRQHTAPLDYDQLAAAYARHRRTHPRVLARLAAVLETGEPRILEIGCGTTNYLTALADRARAGAWGLDPSRQMLANARTQSAETILVAGRGEQLPFPAATFDLTYSVDVIHHIRDRHAYFMEAFRVLKPGGRICTVTDSAEDIAERRPLSVYFPETVAVELRRYPAIPQLRTELQAAGFAEITEQRTSLTYDLTDIEPYRQRSFSSLHLIDADAFATGLMRMEQDLARGPIAAVSLYTLLWARKSPRGS